MTQDKQDISQELIKSREDYNHLEKKYKLLIQAHKNVEESHLDKIVKLRSEAEEQVSSIEKTLSEKIAKLERELDAASADISKERLENEEMKTAADLKVGEMLMKVSLFYLPLYCHFFFIYSIINLTCVAEGLLHYYDIRTLYLLISITTKRNPDQMR